MKQRFFHKFLFAFSLLIFSTSSSADLTGPEMEMVCRGGGVMVARAYVTVSGATGALSQPYATIDIAKAATATAPNGINLTGGQCSFLRRAIAFDEPSQLKQVGLDISLSSVACYSPQCPFHGPHISSQWDFIVTDFTKIIHLKVQRDGAFWQITALNW